MTNKDKEIEFLLRLEIIYRECAQCHKYCHEVDDDEGAAGGGVRGDGVVAPGYGCGFGVGFGGVVGLDGV